MACQAGNDYCTSETDQAQTLRLLVEHAKREVDQQGPDQMPVHKQTGQTYEVEVETEVPIEVSRQVPSEVRSEMYRLVDMICSMVKALFETDPKLWPNSPSYCPDLLDTFFLWPCNERGGSPNFGHVKQRKTCLRGRGGV